MARFAFCLALCLGLARGGAAGPDFAAARREGLVEQVELLRAILKVQRSPELPALEARLAGIYANPQRKGYEGRLAAWLRDGRVHLTRRFGGPPGAREQFRRLRLAEESYRGLVTRALLERRAPPKASFLRVEYDPKPLAAAYQIDQDALDLAQEVSLAPDGLVVRSASGVAFTVKPRQ